MQVLMIGPGLTVKGGISTVERLILEYWNDPTISVEHLSSYEDGSFLRKLGAFSSCLLAVVIKSLQAKRTLVHVHFSHRGSTLRKMILFIAVRWWAERVILHSHGSDFHLFYDALPRCLKAFVRWCLLRTDTVIALSESWKKFFVDQVGLPESLVKVLKNPVERFDREHPPNVSMTRILFLGRLEQRKGVFDLIRAMELLKVEGACENLELVIAGDGGVDEVREQVTKRELEGVIDVVGWVDREGVGSLLRCSDVFVLPSYNEGLPMALLEAMGSGMAVIATPVGGVPEVLDNGVNGVIVEPGRPIALAKTIKMLLPKELQTELGEAARLSMNDFSVEMYCQRLSGIYRSLM